MKRLVSIVLALVMMLSVVVLPVSAYTPAEIKKNPYLKWADYTWHNDDYTIFYGKHDNISFELNLTTGALTVEGKGKMPDYGYRSAPWYGYNSYVKSITIGNELTSIGKGAFYFLLNTTKINWGKKIKTIGEGAFAYDWGLTKVTVPKTVKTVDKDAFIGCKNMTKFTSDAAANFGRRVFMDCKKLSIVKIPNAKSFGKDSFDNCPKLKTLNFPKATLATYVAGVKNNNIINITAKSVGKAAFCDSDNLKKVTLTGKTAIPNSAFYDCDKLTTVTAKNVTQIDGYAFYSCDKLSKITFAKKIKVGTNAFEGCKKLKFV